MTIKKTLGGRRLGSGSKLQVELHNFERSTHDLSAIWRSSMTVGTLVPFVNLVGLPGDTFDIDLDAVVKTLPTIGPLFGSMKVQLDVFQIPMRLYNAAMHNNKYGIGMNMKNVKLPLLKVQGRDVDSQLVTPIDIQQISPSSLLAYLGLRGIGIPANQGTLVERKINAIPFLGYWDIVKNYYCNKMEDNAFVIHTSTVTNPLKWEECTIIWHNSLGGPATSATYYNDQITCDLVGKFNVFMMLKLSKNAAGENGNNIRLNNFDMLSDIFSQVNVNTSDPNFDLVECTVNVIDYNLASISLVSNVNNSQKIQLTKFPLNNIDVMRENILQAPTTSAFEINSSSIAPYGLSCGRTGINNHCISQFSQEGLAIKTYQSDILNNWLKTEYLDGSTGVNEITKVDVTGGYLYLDRLNIAQKVYKMMNRVLVSGGSYYDWIEAVWGVEPYEIAETPMYCGGLSKELVFQEVVSSVETTNKPQGNLSGRGHMSSKHKGGKVIVKVKQEPSYIMGIVSITPRVDYSQGNEWDIDLKTLDDLHKPSMDEIGFQSLITEEAAWWDTINDVKLSAGKQPAWIHYMTNKNKCFGDFADPNKAMFMTLNRRYERNENTRHIADMTTYIDPEKFNQIFADHNLDSQNYWTQIAAKIIARRKMSAKVMPNL